RRYSITALCRLFGVTKQAYFKDVEQTKLIKLSQESLAVEFIHSIRKINPGIGGKKLWYMYCKEFNGNAPLGRDRFETVVDKYGLKVRRKIRKPRTTDSRHGLPLYPNLIKTVIPTAPNQLWVSDITYIPIWIDDEDCRFCYLSLIMDAYSEEIMGYQVGATLEAFYSIMSLKKALRTCDEREADLALLIHHSDRGVQYASSKYVNTLKERLITISMTENGNPKDNPQAERVNSTFKNELFYGRRFRSLAEVKTGVEEAVEFYNKRRPHMSIDMMTPQEASLCQGRIKKKWHSYRDSAIYNQSDILDNP
ncbi:MAG: IS3 family transposase, partial [Phocaeicola sp.]